MFFFIFKPNVKLFIQKLVLANLVLVSVYVKYKYIYVKVLKLSIGWLSKMIQVNEGRVADLIIGG